MREVPFADPDVDEAPAFLAPDIDEIDGGARTADRRRRPHRLLEKSADDDPRFVLPPAGTGARATRRRERRRSVFRRNAGITVLAVLILAVLVMRVARPWSGGKDSTKQAAPAGLPATLPSSAVLVQQDALGAAGSITLLVANPSGRGGRIVFVPPATMSEIPS